MLKNSRSGFTLTEFLVVVAIIAILCSLILPAIANKARELSRKQTCNNNLQRIGVAMLDYENAYRRYTSLNCTWGYGGYAGIPFWNVAPGYGGVGRWSGIVGLLPYLNEGPLYWAFNDGVAGQWNSQNLCWGPYGSVAGAKQAATMGATQDALRYVWSAEYKPSRTQIGTLRCPSDSSKIRPGSQWNLARTNYAFCLGDGQVGINVGDPAFDMTRGGFQNNKFLSEREITDGQSNVVMFGEIATTEMSALASENQGTLEKDARVQGRAVYELAQRANQKGIDVTACRAQAVGGRYIGTKRNWGNVGTRAYDALAVYTGFNTVNAPNAGSCTPTNNAWGEGEGIYTVSSYHFGGAHVVTFDGTVKFISNEINTSDNRTGTSVAEYYSPGRAWAGGSWINTPNWNGESPFGAWGAMGTRAGNDYCNCERPVD